MEYSICIRTLGRGGENYKKLANSINNLSIKPKEVLIVIPKGYELPKDKIEGSTIVFSEKGMLLQRIIGYEKASAEYVLLLDDDVEFEPAMIEKLSKPVLEGKSALSFPIYEELLPQKGIKWAVSALTLSAIPSLNDKSKYVKILPSGGYMYNRNYSNTDGWLYSESAPGMCVFGERQALININLRDELWVEKSSYPLREDAVLIYKAFLKHYEAVGVENIEIEHLDTGSSENNRNIKAAYATTLNHIIFWHRFIFKERKNIFKKIIAALAIGYWSISITAYFIIKLAASRDFTTFKASIKGIASGFKYITSVS
ncbi:glycosyltransferase family 2 protein [Clostridium culturomicium]|uniref:glycosyltransferase family 2 protein n=1 Tax=Clostridium culturomicium TaxID=1499683 RepID=UPI00059145D8|nr:glycosyltransferase family 2 protein [Clostridium culturomicium]